MWAGMLQEREVLLDRGWLQLSRRRPGPMSLGDGSRSVLFVDDMSGGNGPETIATLWRDRVDYVGGRDSGRAADLHKKHPGLDAFLREALLTAEAMSVMES